MTRSLVFVYNVDGTPTAMLRDLYTGLKTGSTDCHLCDITFGRLLKDRTWKRFVDELPMEVDFQLRSTFRKAHPSIDGPFPAAYVIEGDEPPEVFLDAAALEQADHLDALRAVVLDAVRHLTDA